MHTRLEVRDESLRGKLHLYALLAPHIARMAWVIPGGVVKSARTNCCALNVLALLRLSSLTAILSLVLPEDFHRILALTGPKFSARRGVLRRVARR